MVICRYIGIDLGTSSTIVKTRDIYDLADHQTDLIRSLKIDGEVLIPSAAFVVEDAFDNEDNFYFGKAALSCQLNGTLYTNFKLDLLNTDDTKREKAKRIIEVFLSWLKDNYDEQEIDYLGKCKNTSTMIGYPVKWSPDLKSYMEEATKRAGFSNVKGHDEASAAIQYAFFSELGFMNQYDHGNVSGKRVLLNDMGAGTSDFVVGIYSFKTKSFLSQITYPSGRDDICFGGSEFDNVIFDFILSYLISNGYTPEKENYNTILAECKQWKEDVLSPCLQKKQTITKAPEFVDLLLNRKYKTSFPIIDRTYFECAFREKLNLFADAMEAVISKASSLDIGIHKINDIDMVILTGGHSQWYFVNEFLTGNQLVPDGRDISPDAVKAQKSNLLQLSNPSETVALGLVFCSPIEADEDRQGKYDGTAIVGRDKAIPNDSSAMEERSKRSRETIEEDPCFSKADFGEDKEVGMDQNLKLNLLVAGKAGVGKTTLINTIFNAEIGEVRDDKPTTIGVEKLSIPYFPVSIYDVQGFELSNAEATMKMIKDEISKEQATVKEERLIHAILYCINSSSRRFEAIVPDDKSKGQEERFIRQLASEYKVPVFIVFTQAYAMKTNDNDTRKLENLISSVKSCAMPVQGYYPLLCERTAGVDPFGVNDLVQDLIRVLPAQMAELVAGARERALKIKHDKATSWIWGYAAANFALGAVIPAGADVLYLMGIESAMAVHITAILYKDTNVDAKDIIADVVAVCGGPLLGAVGGQIAFTEVLKVGSYVITIFTGGVGAGAAVAAAFAGGLVAAAITVALGRTYLFIAEGLITGKIDKEKIKNKDPKTMQQITNVMQNSYHEARKQVAHDERFSKGKFGKKK